MKEKQKKHKKAQQSSTPQKQKPKHPDSIRLPHLNPFNLSNPADPSQTPETQSASLQPSPSPKSLPKSRTRSTVTETYPHAYQAAAYEFIRTGTLDRYGQPKWIRQRLYPVPPNIDPEAATSTDQTTGLRPIASNRSNSQPTQSLDKSQPTDDTKKTWPLPLPTFSEQQREQQSQGTQRVQQTEQQETSSFVAGGLGCRPLLADLRRQSDGSQDVQRAVLDEPKQVEPQLEEEKTKISKDAKGGHGGGARARAGCLLKKVTLSALLGKLSRREV